MTLAIKRLQNIGWLALVFLVSIMLYPLSLNVASVHSDLTRVDQAIRETKREISFLQAELRTRASPQQLEEWNELLYGYKPPSAQQFLAGEHALAGLGSDRQEIKPLLVAANDFDDGAAPAGIIGSPFAPIVSDDSEPAAGDVRDDDVRDGEVRQAARSGAVKTADALYREKPNAGGGNIQPISNRTIKLAAIDEKILSDDLLRDIEKRAARERNGR